MNFLEALKLSKDKYEVEGIGKSNALNKDVIHKLKSKKTGKTYYAKRFSEDGAWWEYTIAGYAEYVAYMLMKHFSKFTPYIKLSKVAVLSFEEDKDGRGMFMITTSSSYSDPKTVSDISFTKNKMKKKLESLKAYALYLKIYRFISMYLYMLGNDDFHSGNIIAKDKMVSEYYLIDFERSFKGAKKFTHRVNPLSDIIEIIKSGEEKATEIALNEMNIFEKASNTEAVNGVIERCRKRADKLINQSTVSDVFKQKMTNKLNEMDRIMIGGIASRRKTVLTIIKRIKTKMVKMKIHPAFKKEA